MTQAAGAHVIVLTRLDGKELVVNADHLLVVEATPDTVIRLTTGEHLMVREPPDEVVNRVAAWRRRLLAGPERRGGAEVVAFPRSLPHPEE
jgi:flagellar protein FlbD